MVLTALYALIALFSATAWDGSNGVRMLCAFERFAQSVDYSAALLMD